MIVSRARENEFSLCFGSRKWVNKGTIALNQGIIVRRKIDSPESGKLAGRWLSRICLFLFWVLRLLLRETQILYLTPVNPIERPCWSSRESRKCYSAFEVRRETVLFFWFGVVQCRACEALPWESAQLIHRLRRHGLLAAFPIINNKMSSPSAGKRRMDTDVIKLYPWLSLSLSFSRVVPLPRQIYRHLSLSLCLSSSLSQAFSSLFLYFFLTKCFLVDYRFCVVEMVRQRNIILIWEFYIWI